MHANFMVLSLSGCTDYMLPHVCNMKMVLEKTEQTLNSKLEDERIKKKKYKCVEG